VEGIWYWRRDDGALLDPGRKAGDVGNVGSTSTKSPNSQARIGHNASSFAHDGLGDSRLHDLFRLS
jgi:hypothetical protein